MNPFFATARLMTRRLVVGTEVGVISYCIVYGGIAYGTLSADHWHDGRNSNSTSTLAPVVQ